MSYTPGWYIYVLSKLWLNETYYRCISGGIQRFGEMMEDAQLCLKPGGLIVFVDGDGTICSTDRLHPAKFPEDASSKEEGSWFRKVVRGMIVS
jgi:hypothetical protein